MGREIRKVIPNWDHPKKECGQYKPMFEGDLETAWRDWTDEFKSFVINELKDLQDEHGYSVDEPYRAFCDWYGSPPDANYHFPKWKEGTDTWWQLYETVSEGTPVSPPFETQQELVDYLVENGDFWDQSRRSDGRSSLLGMSCDPWSKERAESFVFNTQWAPSFVISVPISKD